MATERTRYVTYAEAVLIHVLVMRHSGESHFWVEDRFLIESALARPKHAGVYEGADLVRQAAMLCFGLIKNHPWVGGNKRTATAIMREFLRLKPLPAFRLERGDAWAGSGGRGRPLEG